LECLLISGIFELDKAQDAWNTIYDEYTEAVKVDGIP